MLLLTHAYLVPADLLDQHQALVRQLIPKLTQQQVGVEICIETGPDFGPSEAAQVRVVQLLRFKDAAHVARVQTAESADKDYQKLLERLKALVDLPGQIMSGTYVPGYYQQLLASA